MGGGDTLPKTNDLLPVPNPTASYWRQEPHWLDSHRSTPSLPPQADIVIIGTGIAGVSTAYHLLSSAENNASPSILLLEARQVCSGATGRNGGHIKKLPSTIIDLIDSLGIEAAGEMVKFIRENIYALKKVIETEGIEAQAELRRSFDVSIEKGDAEEVRRGFERQLENGFPLSEDLGFVGEEFAERVSLPHGHSKCLKRTADIESELDYVYPRVEAGSQHHSAVVMAVQICNPAPGACIEYRKRKSANGHPRDFDRNG